MRLVTNGSPNAIRRLTFIAPVSAGTFSGRESESARAQLFEGLDGHTISSASGTWQVRVYSICEEPGAWWLQLSLDGSPEYTIAMRTPLHERAIDTLCRLSGWLAGAARTDETLTVA